MNLPATPIALFALFLALCQTAGAALAGKVINNCNFAIYAKTTRGGGYDSHEMARIAPHGGTYRAKVKAVANGPGVCLKLQHAPADPAWADVYQVEYAQSDTPTGTAAARDGAADWAWFDLSTVDASPFADQWRRLEVVVGPRRGRGKNRCPVLECAPGKTDCEWPVPEGGVMGDCRAGREAEIVFTLCRKQA